MPLRRILLCATAAIGVYVGGWAAIWPLSFSRTPAAARVVGVAWAVFGIPHFSYHASHFHPEARHAREEVTS